MTIHYKNYSMSLVPKAGYPFIIYFLDNINKYISDKTIQTYLTAFQINVDNLKVINKQFIPEAYRIIKLFTTNTTIMFAIYNYIFHGISKIGFLEKFSEEQIKYITDLETTDTKLIACAGSGKTRSVIGRIKFMVEHGLADKDEIYAITFSKHAATDFHRRIRELFPDYENFCQLKNFSTIDSMAKSILCRVKHHRSENVEILSIALRNFLKEATDEEINSITKFKIIKHLFIDEAQDLNNIQFDIALMFKKHFGTTIHLCGDPNQNIYQFRRSSNSYLMEFPAKKFELTLNFRSTQEIIDFSECLKPIATTRSVSGTNKIGPKVTIMTKQAIQIHKLILYFLKQYEKKNDLSNIAIICPTRGTGVNANTGLAMIFNFLKSNHIKVNQLYCESSSDERKRLVDRIPGHINLLTYHGTKGLEFDTVFVMDFYHSLLNIEPTYEEHNINQYLLYVATSRAISKMFICTYINNYGGYLNHWITKVDPKYYLIDSQPKIHKLTFRNEEIFDSNGVTELLEKLSEEDLYSIYELIKVNTFYEKRIFPDHTDIDRGKDEALYGIFCEELFYLCYYLNKKLEPRRFELIEKIVKSKFIIVENDLECNILKKFINTNNLTWTQFDQNKNNFRKDVIKLVEKYFSRNVELNDSIICTNDFINIVEANKIDIRDTYNRYLQPDKYQYNYNNIIFDLFYLVVVQYAYDINHYIYINDHGKEKYAVLEIGFDMFKDINNYVKQNYVVKQIDNKIQVNYTKLLLMGEIDFIEKWPKDDTETIVEIKCVNSINIKYYMQLLLYNFCYYCTRPNSKYSLYRNSFKIINLLTGIEYIFSVSVTPGNMFTILNTLAKVGGLTFSGMNLVYDLETTGAIENQGPFEHKPVIQRSQIYFRNNKYHAIIYPEIIEIAIKDYETGLIIMNKLVKANSTLTLGIQNITGITPNMLVGQPTLDQIKVELEDKLKLFTACNMLAHNGNSFDNKIMLFYKLLNPQQVFFIDTLSVIPVHMESNSKLDKKNLSAIYYQLFKEKFHAHRAMNDVDALIKIMKYLKIEF